MHIYRRGSQGESTPNVGGKGNLQTTTLFNFTFKLTV